MILTKKDIEGRWAEREILSLWETYNPEEDPPVAFWLAEDGSQLCCDCSSDRHAILGEDSEDVEAFDPRIGCDDCKTVIAFD